jgi:cytochrome c biogenesis protein CcdA
VVLFLLVYLGGVLTIVSPCILPVRAAPVLVAGGHPSK